MTRPARRRRAALCAGIAGLLVALNALALPAASASGPQPLNVMLKGGNGVGDITTSGLSCAAGGQGNYRHYSVDAPLPGGVLSNLTGKARASLDVHHDGVEPPVGPVTTKAFLLGTESHLTFSNQRGAVQLGLSSGTCLTPTFAFDGTTIGPGSGTWVVDPASPASNGAYRQATGSGTFTLTAGVGPGADNPYTLSVNGNLTVLQPSLSVSVVTTFWGNLGLDYASRNVSVTYQVTNNGPGDAFATTLVSTASSTSGVTALGPTPQRVGDLAAGQSTQLTVGYHLALFGPCALIILNCQFDTTATMTMPDALDVVATQSAAAHVVAPNFPPPL